METGEWDGESQIQMNLKRAGTHVLAGSSCAQGVPIQESKERPGSPAPRVCCRMLIPLASSQLPWVAHGTGDIGCYSRHYWVVSLDSLLCGFEAAFEGFLLNPSRRQIAISEHHPGARLGPDPEATI